MTKHILNPNYLHTFLTECQSLSWDKPQTNDFAGRKIIHVRLDQRDFETSTDQVIFTDYAMNLSDRSVMWVPYKLRDLFIMNLTNIFTIVGVLLLLVVNKNNASSRYTCFPSSDSTLTADRHFLKPHFQIQKECVDEESCQYSLINLKQNQSSTFNYYFIRRHGQEGVLFQQANTEIIFHEKNYELVTLDKKEKTVIKNQFSCRLI